MNIPETIKIGWREYLIQKGDGKRNEEGDLLAGQIDYEEHVIYLSTDYGKEQMKVTLLHEIMHGIFNKAGHSEWRKNEDLVDSIAEGLYELILDNPNLFKEE